MPPDVTGATTCRSGMTEGNRLLIVDDDEDILTAGRLLLKRHFCEVVTCRHPGQIAEVMGPGRFDAILLDMNFSPGESDGRLGFVWLKRILEVDPDAVVVMITAHGGIKVAVEAMKHGATDFIAKPWDNEKVIATLSAAAKLSASRSEARQLRNSNQELVGATTASEQALLGTSNAMAQVHSLITKTAPTDANVLILGENGTGKSLVAHEIHRQSLRHSQVFMTVDLGALAESLFESELFGHKRGAFTGATHDRVGRLVAANGGTVFLDEIGNIPLHVQAKLLTVLEQRQVTPVGSDQIVNLDVRIVAATNIDRSELNDQTRFRQDLLFRLNTVEIEVPPLRRRSQDVTAIGEHFARLYARKYRRQYKPFSDAALKAAQAYDWPGNVRALRHAVERAVILADGPALEADDLQLAPPPAAASTGAPSAANPDTLEDLNLQRWEETLVAAALNQHQYNISKAAKALGLTRAALYRRMEKFGL